MAPRPPDPDPARGGDRFLYLARLSVVRNIARKPRGAAGLSRYPLSCDGGRFHNPLLRDRGLFAARRGGGLGDRRVSLWAWPWHHLQRDRRLAWGLRDLSGRALGPGPDTRGTHGDIRRHLETH